MSKFIYIDHSIVKTGGHYLEYAQNVLGTVQKEYEIHIATNRILKDAGLLSGYSILPYYKYDIWGDVPDRKKASGGSGLRKKLGEIKFALKRWFLFSAAGYAWEGRKTHDYFRKDESTLTRILLILAMMLMVPFMLLGRVVAKIFWYICKVLKFCLRLLGLSSLPLPNIHSLTVFGKQEAKKEKIRHEFEKGTTRVIKSVKAERGDIIFIPTLSVDDLEGVYRAIQKCNEAKLCTWHLVFRRNIFIGREPEYNRQNAGLYDERRIFIKFSRLSNVFFYTDTEELTRQYERFCGMRFATLPIPTNPDFLRSNVWSGKKPITAVYAGDARKEKGYQFLPDLIDQLEDLAQAGLLRFELQSNFSFKSAKDDPGTVAARIRLINENNAMVQLHMKPMESDEYCAMVRGSDIGLLLYDRQNYYARSSGALAECLGAGIPVVVPSASWLSAQIQPAVTSYQLSLWKKHTDQQLACKKQSAWGNTSILSRIKSILLHTTLKINKSEQIASLRNELQNAFPDIWIQLLIKLRNKPMDNWLYLILDEVFLNGVPDKKECDLPVFGNSSVQTKVLLIPENANRLFGFYDLDERTGQGVVVRMTARFFDKYGYFLEQRSVEHLGRHEQISCTNLFLIPERARMVELSLSTSYYDAPAICSNAHVEFWNSPKNEPISSVGCIYTEVDDIETAVREIMEHYVTYRDSAGEFSASWNCFHNAEKLVQILSTGNLEVSE